MCSVDYYAHHNLKEKEERMIGLLTLLGCLIFLPECVKLSLAPMKISLAWGLIWGIVGYFTTLMFFGLDRQEAHGLLDIRGFSALEFIELMIFGAYLFSHGIWKKFLSLYPGLMIIVPVCMVSMLFAGMFPGMDFYLTALIAGSVITITVAGMVLLLRYAKVDDGLLYIVTVLSILLNIIIYGLYDNSF